MARTRAKVEDTPPATSIEENLAAQTADPVPAEQVEEAQENAKSTDKCVNHPRRNSVVVDERPGVNALGFCDECLPPNLRYLKKD